MEAAVFSRARGTAESICRPSCAIMSFLYSFSGLTSTAKGGLVALGSTCLALPLAGNISVFMLLKPLSSHCPCTLTFPPATIAFTALLIGAIWTWTLSPLPPHSPFTYLLLPVTCFLLSCSRQVLSIRALLCSCVGTASRLGLLGVCGAPCDLGLGKCGQCRIEGRVCTRGHEKRIAWVVAEVVGMGEPQLHKKVMNFPRSFIASCNEILEHV